MCKTATPVACRTLGGADPTDGSVSLWGCLEAPVLAGGKQRPQPGPCRG